MFRCYICDFTSKYKYNLERHLKKVHLMIQNESESNKIITPSSVNNTITPLNQDNDQYFDLRLNENFKVLISGPSRSGKTFFLKNFIENLDIFSKSQPQVITLVYKVMQPIYNELGVDAGLRKFKRKII